MRPGAEGVKMENHKVDSVDLGMDCSTCSVGIVEHADDILDGVLGSHTHSVTGVVGV